MKHRSLYRVELRRLALSKFTWIIAALSLCAPLLGHSLYQQSNPAVMSGRYVANPALAGAAVGAVLWAALALLEADRTQRTRTGILLDAIASPVRVAAARAAALITLSAATCLLLMLAHLPYAILKLDYLFDPGLYLASYLVLTLGTWWISILLAAALYQIAQRIELAGLLYAACAYFSFSRFAADDFFSRWLNPLVITYSDGFSSLYYLRIAFYTRILWLALAGGAWTLSLLCIRRYQKNLIGSVLRGLRKAYLPVIAAILLTAGVLLWVGQPFVDHGPAEIAYREYAQSSTLLRASKVHYRLTANPLTGRLHGVAEYTVTKRGAQSESIGLNPGYAILQISCDGQQIGFDMLPDIRADERRTDFTLPEGTAQTVIIEYEGYPTILRCFAPSGWGQEITPDYVSLSNASSVPTFPYLDLPMTSTLELTLPGNMTPIAEHKLMTDFVDNADGTRTWTAKVPPYSIWLTACDYKVDALEAAGMDVDFIYSRKYEEIMREYLIPDALSEVLTYCTERLGKLKWAGYRRLMLLQRSAIFDGGNAGEGWVEWGESIFTSANLSDPLKGASAAEVFVHEMVHQWWGGLGVYCGDSWGEASDGLWSEEGLTVYTTYRFMKAKYGDAYAQKHYVDVWQAAVDIQERGFYFRHPKYLHMLPEQYRVGLNELSMATNLYCRMPLMILEAERLVGGEERMDEILRAVQQEYADISYETPFTYRAFLDACGLREEDLELA